MEVSDFLPGFETGMPEDCEDGGDENCHDAKHGFNGHPSDSLKGILTLWEVDEGMRPGQFLRCPKAEANLEDKNRAKDNDGFGFAAFVSPPGFEAHGITIPDAGCNQLSVLSSFSGAFGVILSDSPLWR